MSQQGEDIAKTRHRALSVIRSEHRSLTAVLWSLQFLARDPAMEPDFELFSLMIDYIDLFPERFHHPKEDRHLFAALRARTSEADRALDGLTAEHAQGDRMIHDLRHALALYRLGGENARATFAAAVDAYVAFHWDHMHKEEHVVLPLAERVLADEDWERIDAAFSENADPLLGPAARKAFRGLFQTILELAPPPVGVGPARNLEKPQARRT